MKKLVLTLEETRELKNNGAVEIIRNGFDMLVEEDDRFECGYSITIINPYDRVVLKDEVKEEVVEEVKDETTINTLKNVLTGKVFSGRTEIAKYLKESIKNFNLEYDTRCKSIVVNKTDIYMLTLKKISNGYKAVCIDSIETNERVFVD